MKKIVLYIILSFLTFGQTIAQSCSADELDSIKVIRPMPGLDTLIDKLISVVALSELEGDSITKSECLIYLTSFYNRLGDQLNFERYSYRSLEFSKDTSRIPVKDYSTALNNVAFLEKKKGNFKKAIDLILRAIDLEKSTTNSPKDLIYLYHNIATNYNSLGDYENASKSSEKTIEYAKLDKKKPFTLAEAYHLNSIAKKELGRFELAKSNIENGLELLAKLDPSSKVNQLVIQYYQELAEVMISLGELGEGKIHLARCTKLQKQTPFRIYKTLELKGRLSSELENFAEGNIYLSQSLEDAKLINESNKEFAIIPRIYLSLSNNHVKLNMGDEALEFLNLGLEYFNLKDGSILLENIPDDLEISPIALDLLRAKANLFLRQYELEGDTEDLRTSQTMFSICQRYLDGMKRNYVNENSKFFIAEIASEVYKEAAHVFYLNYIILKDEKSLSLLFAAIENNKSSLLIEGLKFKFSLLTTNIPNDQIAKERDYKVRLSYYSKLLEQEIIKGDSIKIKMLNDEVHQLQESHNILKNKLIEEFPSYKELMRDLENDISIHEVQEVLSQDEIIFNYLQTEELLYAVKVSQSDVAIYRVELPEEAKLFSEYLDYLSKPPSSINTSLDSLSKKILNILLPGPELNNKHLIIIPDGELSSIPFESLTLSNGRYLIEKTTISYAYSANQLLTIPPSEKGKNKVLCIAPIFNKESKVDENSTLLTELQYTKIEANYLKNNFDCTMIRSNNTTSKDLLDNLDSHAIIHLATHASLNASNPMLTKIYFNDGGLTNYDFRDLEVRPEMVVLSACNTAQGNHKKGEGLISLSRGFFEAGVKSLVSTLWSVDDYASSKIMTSMYANLKLGYSKPESLRLSKLEYLKTSDYLRSHPYYWAGIIQIGNTAPVFKKRDNLTIYILGILFLGILGLLFMRKSRFFKAKI